MSRDELHQLADHDTPSIVRVPNTITGLLMWATGRFGVGILVAAAAMYATAKVYTDLTLQNARILEVIVAQTRTSQETAEAIKEMRRSIEDQNRTIQEAHRRLPTP